jgi:hypothetical protein
MPRPDFSLDVVGADFPNTGGGNRRFEILLCEWGERIDLVLEPKNPADPNAVAVFSARGIQIGYLRADRAPYIGSRLRLGNDVQAVFQGPRPWGASIRINVEGHAPTPLLEAEAPAPPPQRERYASDRADEYVDPDPGFWPDEVPPDE